MADVPSCAAICFMRRAVEGAPEPLRTRMELRNYGAELLIINYGDSALNYWQGGGGYRFPPLRSEKRKQSPVCRRCAVRDGQTMMLKEFSP
jgi:hypothetical protein